ncbi:MAG: type IV pilus assembly protein PilM [Candidatus Omnitrophica bacterium]|nr:type IV pilus assembly protein PilM [Candidatus Omnitrophota bacterium]
MKELTDRYFPFIKKLIPAQSVRPSVGLDIGVTSCRMVEVVKRSDGYELVRWAIEPIVAGDVAKAIRNIMSKTSQPNLYPVTGLTGKGTLIRFVDMPKMTLADLKRSFSFEVDKYFPFPKDQIFTDCHIIDPVGKDNKLPVLVAAAKKELINDRIKLLGDAGLQVDFVTLNSIAIANVFDVLGSPKVPGEAVAPGPKAVGVLDVGEIVSNLTILVDNRPKFNRDIFIGGRDFTKSIATALRVSADEAEKIKQDPQRAAEISGAVEAAIFDLVSELRLSCDYFVTETNLSLSQLFLTGGGTAMENLKQSLPKQLEIPTHQWDPISLLKLGPGLSASDVNAKSGYLGSALGLALYF